MEKIISFIKWIFSRSGLLFAFIIFIISLVVYKLIWENEAFELIAIISGILSFIIFIVIVTFHFEKDTKDALEILRNISTISILGLAIFGYFFTVRPTWERENLKRDKEKLIEDTTHLNEQIHQKEIELQQLETEARGAYLQNLNATLHIAIGRGQEHAIRAVIEDIYWGDFNLLAEDSNGMRLKDNYEDLLINFIKSIIDIAAGNSNLRNKTIRLLEENKSDLFNYSTKINEITKVINLYNSLVKDCQTDECYKKINEQRGIIKKKVQDLRKQSLSDFQNFINNNRNTFLK